MSIDIEKIGSKFLVSFEGTEVTSSLRELITKYKIMGVVINESNIDDSMQLFHLIKEIKAMAPYPLYVGMDLSKIDENSPIYSDLSFIPPLVSLVASGDLENMVKYILTLTSFYNKMGINIDLTLQGTLFDYTSGRSMYSFGEHTKNVVTFATRYIEHLQEHGIQSGIWGFPGDADSVFEENKIPLNNGSLVDLNNQIHIYKSLIDSNITMLGVSSHLFNAIDNGRPAFTSEIVVKKLVDELECHSLVMANVTAREIINKFRFDDILDLSLKSGIDVLYLENSSENLNKYLEELEDRFDTSGFNAAKIEESAAKIGFSQKMLEAFACESSPMYLEDDEKDVIVKDTFSEQLCEDSILVVEILNNNLPLKLNEFDLVAVVEPEEMTSQYIVSGAEEDVFSFSQYCKDIFSSSFQVVPDEKMKWEDFKQVIYCVNAKSPLDLQILEIIERFGIPITLVSTKGLDLFDYYKDIECSKVVSFGFNEFQRKAVAKIVFGKYENKAINPFKEDV